ncbi:D-Ala-D-Ala carboxypeptidase family metallohydrolase [Rhodoferax sp. U2-2l]|uniref:D-Ala-D-Ala carboxypeptidase family metallohydrolase n=1 Tax=Rhodoferax sp. U2-2l TaxID=2884000 RepID=UPI001D0B6C94|nr:D-Ala-D-Ala carboxypeptidase family metallohydrolase [Rhodoferax sp. U2-2l]MCB8746258.1 D-Ala-D-Ala carboxypeptidase family metallohydrolase [Rhodoferax sp. U2-2l]
MSTRPAKTRANSPVATPAKPRPLRKTRLPAAAPVPTEGDATRQPPTPASNPRPMSKPKPLPAPAPAPKAIRRKRAAPVPRAASGAAVLARGELDLSQTPLAQIHLAQLAPRTLIAPNFRAYELTQSDLASRRGISNGFDSEQHLRSAIHLARKVLQPVRDAFGAFTPNSVYRSQALERTLKNKPATWVSTSQHARGEACDIEIVGKPTLELAAWARDHLDDFDQIICECFDPRQGPNSGWVHISLKAPGQGSNRRQCLSYVPDASGRLVYVPGLQAMA